MSIKYHGCPYRIKDIDSNHIPVNIDVYQIDDEDDETLIGKWRITCDFLVPIELPERRHVIYALFFDVDTREELATFFDKIKALYACASMRANQVAEGTIRGFEKWE